jgi:hypothetical protein
MKIENIQNRSLRSDRDTLPLCQPAQLCIIFHGEIFHIFYWLALNTKRPNVNITDSITALYIGQYIGCTGLELSHSRKGDRADTNKHKQTQTNTNKHKQSTCVRSDRLKSSTI